MKILKMITGTLIIILAICLRQIPEILGLVMIIVGMCVNGMIPYLIKQMKE